jgi:hypothetical protein
MFGIHTDITEQNRLQETCFYWSIPQQQSSDARYKHEIISRFQKWLDDYKLTNKILAYRIMIYFPER